MKAVSKLVLMLSLGSLASASAFAVADEQVYLETCRKDAGVPVPVTVVAPTVAPQFAGSVVQLEFTVDVSGKPAGFSVKSSPDATLAAVVTDAVKQWRFQPAVVDGKPVATKVSLPVKIVDPELPGTRLAVNN